MTKKSLTAVWVNLDDQGNIALTDRRLVSHQSDRIKIVGSTLISSVPVEEGVFGNQDPGKHEVFGESTEKLKTLIDEVKRISTQLGGEQVAIYEQLMEACNEAEGIES